MANFHYLNKSDFPELASAIFKIFRDNMETIAPSGMSCEDEYRWWREAVGDGLKADARQIILVRRTDTNQIIGFFQYYTNETTFMIEEIQILSEYQGTANFLHRLYGFVLANIPQDLEFVEAYARKENIRSIALQRKLGMEIVGSDKSGTLYHLKGRFSDFANWYNERKPGTKNNSYFHC
ncbi:MAG: hypothetical protein IJ001_05120 [Oscillospiraceae bacterium]|nr:hypothetical protein [Oscillospiraceae bacterium]